MLRLFVAIDIPPAIRSCLHNMGRDIPGARPVPRDQLHLTLKFIGDVETNILPSLTKVLATVQTSSFHLALRGVGHFPPRGNPRIVWAGIAPQPDLDLLHSHIDQTLEKLGIARDTQPFSPHVTIARLKNPDPESYRRFLARHSDFRTEPFEIKRFSLYRSKLTAARAIHTLEALYELGK